MYIQYCTYKVCVGCVLEEFAKLGFNETPREWWGRGNSDGFFVCFSNK